MTWLGNETRGRDPGTVGTGTAVTHFQYVPTASPSSELTSLRRHSGLTCTHATAKKIYHPSPTRDTTALPSFSKMSPQRLSRRFPTLTAYVVLAYDLVSRAAPTLALTCHFLLARETKLTMVRFTFSALSWELFTAFMAAWMRMCRSSSRQLIHGPERVRVCKTINPTTPPLLCGPARSFAPRASHDLCQRRAFPRIK